MNSSATVRAEDPHLCASFNTSCGLGDPCTFGASVRKMLIYDTDQIPLALLDTFSNDVYRIRCVGGSARCSSSLQAAMCGGCC